jgi:hypothetical protein
MNKRSINRILKLILLAAIVSQESFAQTAQKRELPQFLFDKFARGIVKMKAGNSYAANLNYSMVDEVMVFEQRGNYMVLDKPREIDTVFLQNRTFVPFSGAFYELVVPGKYPVYIQHKAKYVEAAKTTAYGMTSHTLANVNVTGIVQGAVYRTLDIPENTTVSASPVNWISKNGEMEKLSNANQLIKIFPEKEAELKQYIKSNKPDLKEREDLIKLGKFFNEIMN